jgi:hypothetical protein
MGGAALTSFLLPIIIPSLSLALGFDSSPLPQEIGHKSTFVMEFLILTAVEMYFLLA